MSFEQFPSHWQVLPIAESVDALIDYRGKTPKKTNSGIPLITAKIVKGGTVLPATEFIAEEDYDSWMVRGFPQAGDVVVTTEAPLGEVAQLNDPNVALAQRIVTLRGAKGLLLNDYLRYVMQGSYVQSQMESRASGSTVKGIKQSELRKVLLPIPSLQEQSAISSCLKSLDKKNQLNQKINQTLEKMAQALFKSWFVDFEPVKAKIIVLEAGGTLEDATLAAMTSISDKDIDDLAVLAYEQPEQYAELKATAELFPAAMQDSEFGGIPQGWYCTDLSSLALLNSSSWTKKNAPESVNYVDLANTKWGVIHSTEKFFFSEAPSRARRILKPNDTIMGTVRPGNGSYAFINTEGLTGSTGFVVLTPKQDIFGEFIYLSATTKDNIERLTHLADGGAYPAVNADVVLSTPCVIPAEKEEMECLLNVFSSKVKTLFKYRARNSEQNVVLSQLRDTLLPKLLSGEITPLEAEAWAAQTEPQEV